MRTRDGLGFPILHAVCDKIFEGCDVGTVPGPIDLQKARRHLVRNFDVVAIMEDLEAFRLAMVHRWGPGGWRLVACLFESSPRLQAGCLSSGTTHTLQGDGEEGECVQE